MNTSTSATQKLDSAAEVMQASKASRVRWSLMGIVMAIMAVTALNRLNLSIAGKVIEEQFSINTIAMGTVFSAFLWGYGLTGSVRVAP